MDPRQEQVTEAAEKLTDTAKESYRAVAGRAVLAQELNTELTQSFFKGLIKNLRARAESNRATTQQLVDQQQRAQGATRVLAQQTVKTYIDFVNSAFSFYQGSLEKVERNTEATPRVSSRSKADESLPLENYDSLNVEEITDRMEGLSVEVLRQLRAYEARNKNRSTLLERLNQKIEAGSSS